MKKIVLALGIMFSFTLVSCQVVGDMKEKAGEISQTINQMKDTIAKIEKDLKEPIEKIKKLHDMVAKLEASSQEVLDEVKSKEPIVLDENYTWREFLVDYEAELDSCSVFTNSVDINNLNAEDSKVLLRHILMISYWQENADSIMKQIPEDELEEYGIALIKVVDKLKTCFPEDFQIKN